MNKSFLIHFLYSLIIASSIGCTNIFLRPDSRDYSILWKERSEYVQEAYFASEKNKLHYWLIGYKNIKPEAIVLQFHGNAENLTSHALSVGWLTDHNFQVLSYDYPGYGKSSGQATLDSALTSIKDAIIYARGRAKNLGVPLILYGQSIGGSLLLKYLKDSPQMLDVSLVIIESSFYSYPQIAREKLSNFFLTWPFQWIAYLLISSKYDPGGEDLSNLSDYNIIFLHSENDMVVPIHHGEQLYEKLGPDANKTFFKISEPGHISFSYASEGKHRQKLLNAILEKSK